MDFEDLVAMLAAPGEDGLPDTFSDDLVASYQNATTTRDAKIGELQGMVDTGNAEKDAAIETLQNQLAEMDAELTAQKLINYELLTAAPGDSGGDNDNTDNNAGETDNSGGFDSLFENVER